MASFPTLTHGTVALFPLTECSAYLTGVFQHVDGTEQRFRKRAPLAEWTLQFDRISKADKNTIQGFFDSVKGGFDSTWDITIGGTLYAYMCFVDSALTVTEAQAGLYSVTAKIRQTRKN